MGQDLDYLAEGRTATDLTSIEPFRRVETFTVIEGRLAMKATGDRIIILEDRFRTGYECKGCDGAGFLSGVCKYCNGELIIVSDREDIDDRACSNCMRDGRPTGKELCPSCKGHGATIIVPQTSERASTSGRVMSCGPLCKYYKVGDHVLYGSYAGTKITFQQKNIVRIASEDEIIALLYAAKGLNYSEVAL